MNTQDTYNPGQERVMPTATPNIVTEQARNDPQGNVDALVSALGAGSTQREIAAFNQQHEAQKLEEQKAKIGWYVNQFQQDHTSGAVSQAQVKARFPETVPVIASRISEALGQEAGEQAMQSAVDEIAGNDTLRLDTTARAAYLAKKKADLTATVGEGNEFYGSGLVSGIDKVVSQHEINWQTETAAYHQKVQSDQFSSGVVDALNSGKPQDLLDLDTRFKASSSLNDIERNQLVVKSAIDLAFTNDDPALLKVVPARFLNADAKAHLEAAKVQMIDRRISDRRTAQELIETRRKEDQRAVQIKIIGDVVDGKTIDPAAYRDTPEGYAFALQMREVSRLDESTSVAHAQIIRNAILTQSTTERPATVQELTDQIVGNKELNPSERQALIKELPKLVEGRNLMADDMVRQPIADRVNPRLTALEQSTNSAVQALLTGRNPRSEVMKGYQGDIRRSFQSEYEESGKWPTGHRKLELIDQAVDRAEKLLENLTRISSMDRPAATVSPAPTALRATPASARRAPYEGPRHPNQTNSAGGRLPVGVIRLPD